MMKVKFGFLCFTDWNNSSQSLQSTEGTSLVMEGNTDIQGKDVMCSVLS
jgi:hypothetical protein